jgi:putative transcriptional regulator
MEKEMFEELLSSVKEAKDIMQGKKEPSRRFYIDEPNAKEIRQKLQLTQNQFASLMNISIHTLRNWEQGRRQPEGPAKVLLNVANNHPNILIEMIN